MNKIYLDLEEREGRFFEYSKDPKSGFEKHESSAGKVSYRKIYDKGLVGKLKYINESEGDFGKGKFKIASIVVENKDGDILYSKIPVLTGKGGLNEYFEQLVPYLPNLSIGETYRFFPYAMEVEYETKLGEKRKSTKRGFSIYTYDVDADVKVDKVERAHSFGKDGDIPDVVWNEEKDMGVIKKVRDDKARRNYLYDIFLSTLSKSNSSESKQPEAPKPSAKAPAQNPAFPEDDEHDDLPF